MHGPKTAECRVTWDGARPLEASTEVEPLFRLRDTPWTCSPASACETRREFPDFDLRSAQQARIANSRYRHPTDGERFQPMGGLR